jgi:hypothetical protein
VYLLVIAPKEIFLAGFYRELIAKIHVPLALQYKHGTLTK